MKNKSIKHKESLETEVCKFVKWNDSLSYQLHFRLCQGYSSSLTSLYPSAHHRAPRTKQIPHNMADNTQPIPLSQWLYSVPWLCVVVFASTHWFIHSLVRQLIPSFVCSWLSIDTRLWNKVKTIRTLKPLPLTKAFLLMASLILASKDCEEMTMWLAAPENQYAVLSFTHRYSTAGALAAGALTSGEAPGEVNYFTAGHN